jgi:rubrerythrin
MAVTTIADVLQQAERFEQMLADYYAELAENTTREGVRMLTDYMSRHRVRISAELTKLPSEQVSHICASPLRYQPDAADCKCFDGLNVPPDATANDILGVAMILDECLMGLYRQVLQQDVEPEVRELFESLLRSEQRDEIELKKIRAMDYF